MGSKTPFDLRIVASHFDASVLDEDNVRLHSYIQAWEELNKMFKLFGGLFSFVQSDVAEKVQILESYRTGDEQAHFNDIKSMIEYEIKLDRTRSLRPPSASRTLLVLHRALEFVVRLIRDIHNSRQADKISKIARKAYDDTLANRHRWIVRTGVHVAVRTLPSRKKLVQKLSIGTMTTEEAERAMEQMVVSAQNIYDKTQTLYARNELLHLP